MLALHGAALWGLSTHRLIPAPEEAVTLFVDFIAPSVPPRVEPAPVPRRELPKPQPAETPLSPVLAAEAPVTKPAEVPVPLSSITAAVTAPVIAAPVVPKPDGPLTLGSELAVSCPGRTAPGYPLLSRRLGEAGSVVLRVELDEQGRVDAARVATGSGFARLDEAALSAVKSWRCNPAQRDGQAVRAIALQPFKFVLQGN